MMTSHASPRFDLDSIRAANVLAAHPYGTEASLDRDQAGPNSAELGPAVTKLPKPDNG
jgi:hypothetical protein